MTGIDADHRQAERSEFMPEPGRRRTGFQTDTLRTRCLCLDKAAIAVGSEITVPSLTISPLPSTTQIDVSLSDTSIPT
jgi:hypothetical protein